MVSDVPLTKDIVARKKEFVPTRSEFLISKGQRKEFFNSSSGPRVTVFEVPQNKTFLLTEMSINNVHTGTQSFAQIDTAPRELFAYSIGTDNTQSHQSLVVVFSYPIEFPQGSKMELFTTSPSNTLTVHAMGYLIDKNIIGIL